MWIWRYLEGDPNGPKMIGKRKRMGKMMRTSGLLGLFSGKLVYIYLYIYIYMFHVTQSAWKLEETIMLQYVI